MAINRIKTGGITDGTIQSGDLAPGTIASDRIAPGTIANDRLANTSITINGTSIALGASGEIVAGTDWQAVTVADGSTTLNAVAGRGYFLDTNTGVIEVFLPTSPTRGDTIFLVDYSGTWGTNKVILNTGGVLIDSTQGLGSGSEFELTTNNSVVELVYVDSAKGWLVLENEAKSGISTTLYTAPLFTSATGGTVTESGDYKIHTFTGDGCFVVSQVGTGAFFPCSPIAGPAVVDYMVVAGGGGSAADAGGGGGAGGFRESHSTPVSGCYTASPLATCTGITVTATTYPITVGAGGVGDQESPVVDQTNGSPSIFSTITSAGGGFGASNGPKGGDGGSGGGARVNNNYPVGGSGNTPPVSPPQGNPGGGNQNPAVKGGGGGGATQAGGPFATGGNGGAGATTSISGSPTAYAGGGGGGSNSPSEPGSSGGTGGGGTGGPYTARGTAGTANTGGGGGAAGGNVSPRDGQPGGKGIVIIRYKFQ